MKRVLSRVLCGVLLLATLFLLCACASAGEKKLKIVRAPEESESEEQESGIPLKIQPSFVGSGSPLEPQEFLFSGRVFMMGDSTMCGSYSETRVEKIDIMGWGNPFADYFLKTSGDLRGVKVYNYASSGASSRSFQEVSTTTGDGKRIKIYDYVMEHLKAGDYLFVQFGHNDEDYGDSQTYTSAALSMDQVGEDGTDASGTYSFEWVLYHDYIKPCLDVGAVPVLVTPIALRNADSGLGNIEPHKPYRAVMQRLAENYQIPLIDLSTKTSDYYAKLVNEDGALATARLHAFSDDNRTMIDGTHLSRYGAFVVAGLAAEELSKTDLTLKNFILGEPTIIRHPREN